MKFNIGDKVRLTRKWILSHLRHINTTEEDWLELAKRLINWFEIRQRDIGLVYADENGYCVKEEHLELVEEDDNEFGLWEMVEASDDLIEWSRVCYIKKDEDNLYKKYMTVIPCRWEIAEKDSVYFNYRRYVRKIKQTLTRKEIAEMFDIDEDFELVD